MNFDVRSYCERLALWAFIGPLADELRVTGDGITAQEKQSDGRYLGHLEATFAAVCMKLEAAKP